MSVLLSKGMKSDTVALVQSRLKVLGFFPKKQKCTGLYGDITAASVLAFQKKKFPVPAGLSKVKQVAWKKRYWDGIVGPTTWAAMFPKPSKPAGPVKKTVAKVVGKVTSKPRYWAMSQDGRKKALGGSEAVVRKHLVSVVFLGHKFSCHSLVKARFEAVERRIRAYEKAHNLKPWSPKKVGVFNWRLVRGSKHTLSNHSWGIAIDFDWNVNPMTTSPSVIKAWYAHPHIPKYVRDAFRKEGARFGGDYKTRKDFMHFEF